VPDEEKDVFVMQDESLSSLKKGLSFDPAKDQVNGFVQYGERGRTNSAATHALVYQIKIIYGDWRYPVAYYLTDNGTTGETLAIFGLEVIPALIKAGFRARVLVGDLLQANVKMAFLLGARDGELFFFVDGHEIYCISDPPHLLKAVGNAMIKYAFVFSSKKAKRKDIIHFFLRDATFF